MDSADELLLLAHAIRVYDRVLRDLEDLANLRLSVPYAVEGRVRQQLVKLSQLWWADVHGDPVWVNDHLATVATEAREWAETHHVRLAELREGKDTE